MSVSKPYSLLAVTALSIIFAPQQGSCVQRMALNNGDTYTFQNVANRGYLTSVYMSDLPVTDSVWRDTPGQKWEVQKGFLYTTYLLKPLSEGIGSKIALSSVWDGQRPIVKKEPYTFGMASRLYWSIVPVRGYDKIYLIQNFETDLCLEAGMLGDKVGVSRCTEATTQRWAVHARPKDLRVQG